MRHGSILGGVVSTPSLDDSIDDYCQGLGLTLIEREVLAPDLAKSWGCLASAGSAVATLQPKTGADCFLRLVEQPLVPDFVPTRTYGWAAYEISVADVFGLVREVENRGFEIIGPPKELKELPFFVPMQVTGRGGEMLYLNEVRMDTPDSDLPKSPWGTDRIFIVILATPDRIASAKWYEQALGLYNAAEYELVYDLINEAFELPLGQVSKITLMQNGRMPIIEIDDYPVAAKPRPGPSDRLPPGNALVTLAVEDIRALSLPFVSPPIRRDGPIYRGRTSATLRGNAGELIELVSLA